MNRKKKGFTLMELIIVIAIIGILLAILVPTWGYFLRRARVRTANNKAKIIFNAAQTAVTEYSALERSDHNGFTDYVGNGAFYFYWDGSRGYRLSTADANPVNEDGSADAIQNGRFADKINKILDDDMIYKVYVSGYNVQSVVCARTTNDRYYGAFPKTIEDAGVDPSSVIGADMADYDLV